MAATYNSTSPDSFPSRRSRALNAQVRERQGDTGEWLSVVRFGWCRWLKGANDIIVQTPEGVRYRATRWEMVGATPGLFFKIERGVVIPLGTF